MIPTLMLYCTKFLSLSVCWASIYLLDHLQQNQEFFGFLRSFSLLHFDTKTLKTIKINENCWLVIIFHYPQSIPVRFSLFSHSNISFSFSTKQLKWKKLFLRNAPKLIQNWTVFIKRQHLFNRNRKELHLENL